MGRIYIKLANGSRITLSPAGKEIYLANAPARAVYRNTLRGQYRMEDTSLIRYELYQGVDAQPNFTAPAWQTFAALPFTTPALATGHTYNFVCRKRNQHNLVSQNVGAYQLVLDGSGNSQVYPSAPSYQSMTAAAGGAALISATYDANVDPAGVVADTWAVWLTSDGSTPNTAGAATYTQLMTNADGQPKLQYTTTQFAHGTILKAIVRVRRSGAPNVDSQNSTVLQVTADAVGPLLPQGGVFFGLAAEQFPLQTPPGAADFSKPIQPPVAPEETQPPRGHVNRRPKYP